MSVQFAQQTELTRLNKHARQRCTSMQTQSVEEEEEVEERENEERTPRASPPSCSWLEGVEKERLERELEEKAAEIRTLKEELQKTKSAPKQVSVANGAPE